MSETVVIETLDGNNITIVEETTTVVINSNYCSLTVGELEDVTLDNVQNGQILIYNSTTNKWENGLDERGDMKKSVYDTNDDGIVDNSDKLDSQEGSYYLDRTNHTGTQTASTISDFDTEVSNNTDVSANTTHRTSDGSDHTFINQDVTTNATPSFANIISNNQATANNHVVRLDQMNLAIQGVSWQEPVDDQIDFTTSEPSSPSNGDRYINLVTGTSSETSQSVTANNIYQWNGSSWDEEVVEEGWSVWDKSADTNFTFNGTSWVEFGNTISHNNTMGLQGGAGGEFYHLNALDYNGRWQSDGTNVYNTFGNVGIGTTSPTFKLDVLGATRIQGNLSLGTNYLAFDTRWNIYNSTNSLYLTQAGTGGAELAIMGDGVDYTNATLKVGNNVSVSSNGTSYFNGGNIGIGNSSPLATLDILGFNMALGRDPITTYNKWDFRINHKNLEVTPRINDGNLILLASEDTSDLKTGNVGIKTISPVTDFEVNGRVRIDESTGNIPTTGSGMEMIYTAGIGKIYGYDRDNSTYMPLSLGKSDGSQLYLTSDGNVGIGTITPTSKFYVNGMGVVSDNFGVGEVAPDYKFQVVADATTGRQGIKVRSNSYNSGDTLEVGFRMTSSDGWNWAGMRGIRTNLPNTGNTELRFFTYGASGVSDKVIISTDGDLGVGTMEPASKLHVLVGESGGNPYVGSILTVENSGRAIIQMLTPNNSDQYIMFGDNDVSNKAWVGYDHNIDQIKIHTGSTISMDGNVGVNTTTPACRFHIEGGTDTSYPTLKISKNNSAFSPTLDLDNQYDTGKSWTLRSRPDGDFRIRQATDEIDYLSITSLGNIGIGTTTPSGLLHLEKDNTGGNVLYINNTGTSRSLEIDHTGGTGYDDVIRINISSSRVLTLDRFGTLAVNNDVTVGGDLTVDGTIDGGTF